jgi:hypothetical protein
MFKQIVVILILILILIYFYPSKSSFVLIENMVKYPITKSTKTTETKKLNEITDTDVFFIDLHWSSSNNNFIYDTLDDRYYIIDKGYYYNIPKGNRYSLEISKNVNVKFFKIK